MSTQEAEDLARELGLSYIETSAKTGENINDAFKMLAMQMIKRFLETEDLEQIETKTMAKENNEFKRIIPEFTRNYMDEEPKAENSLIQQVKVRMKDIWPSLEEDFTPWLEKNIDLLNNLLKMTIITVDIKSGTILGKDKYGSKVLIECQYGETREEILGKILTSIIRHGIKIAIWICEEPLNEHLRTINSLNKSMMNDAIYYLVKVEAFEKESKIHPQFQIVCDPSEIKVMIEKNKKLDEISEILSPENKRLKFWNQMVEKININSLDYSHLKADKSSWLIIPTNRESLSYVYRIKENWSSIELFFDHENRLVNNERFKQLFKKKDEIFLFSHSIEWDYDEIRNFQTIRVRVNEGLSNEKNWETLQEKMIEIMSLLKEKIDPHLNSLKL